MKSQRHNALLDAKNAHRGSVIRVDIVRTVISRKPSAARPIESSSEESGARLAASKELRWAPHSEDEQNRARDRH